MPNPTKHSPVPWTVELDGDHKDTRVKADKGLISVAICGPWTCVASRLNAAHIVHCVNLHDELVEALKACENYCNEDTSGSYMALTAARTVLAKAEGK